MKTRLAIFDFDGTITKHDTFLPFLVFCFGYVKVCYIALTFFPSFLMYTFHLISNSKAKEILFEKCFKKIGQDDFNQLCKRYSLEKISPGIRINALVKMIRHRMRGDKIIILSASVENWIRPWADSYGVDHVIGTTVETKDGVLTGKFAGPNCYGKEKVRRLIETCGNLDQYHICSYGDSKGDKDLLAVSDEPFYQLF